MKRTLHRSENLSIALIEESAQLEFEIRFSTSSAKGGCDARCPRCQAIGKPSHWELEGPDSRGNTVWMVCPPDDAACKQEVNEGFRWSQTVVFPDGWSDKGE